MKFNARQRIKYLQMFNEYLQEYGSEYSDTSLEFIKNHFLENTDIASTPDILLQIYAKLGMLNRKENIYLQFANMIGKLYGWHTNILEIAGGYYPMFSKYVSDKQSEKRKGTITVMDPKLVVSHLDGVKLEKKEFNLDLEVSDFGLLVGIAPCETTLDIVSSALINKKEFFIALCGCPKSRFYAMPMMIGYQEAYKYWVQTIYNLACEQRKDYFEVTKTKIDTYPYPIIYSKKLKKN